MLHGEILPYVRFIIHNLKIACIFFLSMLHPGDALKSIKGD